MEEQRSLIQEQFTQQAERYAASPIVRNEQVLDAIVAVADPQPMDELLDVACGTGILTLYLAARLASAPERESVKGRVTGIDLTEAMLAQARAEQERMGLTNVLWQRGDVQALPYPDASFSLVLSRFAFHHFAHPLAVLREMQRVCRPGGRLVIADVTPAQDKADAFNAMELLRDPSHVQALSLEAWLALFAEAGLARPAYSQMRIEGELDALLARSFPHEGDEPKIRALFEQSLQRDGLDVAPVLRDGQIYYSLPITIFSSKV